MDQKSIQDILRFVNKSDLTEVEIEHKDFKLKVKRKNADNVVVQSVPLVSQMPVAQAPVQAVEPPVAQPPATPAVVEAPPAVEENKKLFTFKSPMIGTFYRASSPDKPPFIKVGDDVSNGQTMCIIEAMKLFNEIDSDIEGKIVKILVEDAKPVEYDQPLFLIELS